MNCPVCGEKTKVIDSRSDCESVERTRQCVECGYRFKTIEYEEDMLERLVSHDKT